ncbi:MAG: exosortase/archaeosortase family protein [Acidobacteriota bacterium]
MRSGAKAIWSFAACTLAAAAMGIPPLVDLLRHAHPSWYYTHIPVIPAISAWFLYRRRNEAFPATGSLCWPGLTGMAAGAALFAFGRPAGASLNAAGFVSVSAALVFWWGSFLLLFGARAFRKARFPMLFLIFAVPLPTVVIEGIIKALVSASAEVTGILFAGLGVPFVREGSVFHLPGFSLEVASECSGIRSTLALLITSILAGQLFLRGPLKKIVLAAAVFPVSVFKNGVRIMTLYLLSYFVDMRIVDGGFLHRSGGFLFFGLGLVVLGYVLWVLRDSKYRC